VPSLPDVYVSKNFGLEVLPVILVLRAGAIEGGESLLGVAFLPEQGVLLRCSPPRVELSQRRAWV